MVLQSLGPARQVIYHCSANPAYKESFQKNIPVCHAVLPLAPEAVRVGVCSRDSIRRSCQPRDAIHVVQSRGPQPSSSLTCSSSLNFSPWSLCSGALLSASSLELFCAWVPLFSSTLNISLSCGSDLDYLLGDTSSPGDFSPSRDLSVACRLMVVTWHAPAGLCHLVQTGHLPSPPS